MKGIEEGFSKDMIGNWNSDYARVEENKLRNDIKESFIKESIFPDESGRNNSTLKENRLLLFFAIT